MSEIKKRIDTGALKAYNGEMAVIEGGSLEQRLAKQYALEVLGKGVINHVFEGEVSDVKLVEIRDRPAFVELANGRPFFDRLIEPGTIITTVEGKKTWPNNTPKNLFERLNMSPVPRQRRQDLGGIIGDQLKLDSEDSEEWPGAGLELLAETRRRFAADVDSPMYESVIGKSILFPGVLLVGRKGTYVASIEARGGGPKIGFAQFQQDYDAEEGEWAVARGSGILKKRPLEK